MSSGNFSKRRDYNNHPQVNSDYWDLYKHRPDDVLIATPHKSGTTWMQVIVANLIFQDGNFPDKIGDLTAWFEFRSNNMDDVISKLEKQEHRRFLKTHLPFDGLPYYDTMKYIVIARDGRDIFMSLWNQISGYTDGLKSLYKKRAEEFGVEYTTDYDDIHQFWNDWISKSFFDWQSEGYPIWSPFYLIESWWQQREKDNFLFIHYADMLSNTEDTIRKVAHFLNIEIDEELLPGILERISFNYMKSNFEEIMPGTKKLWHGGGDRFMHKGENEQWRGVLSADELKQYDEAIKRSLSPDAARWMENGGDV